MMKMTTLINGHVVLVENDDMVVQASRKNNRKRFEYDTYQYWLKSIEANPDKVALDIGSYTGIYAIGAKKQFNATVFAFEPNRATYARLLENMKHNNVRFRTLRLALSDHNGKKLLYSRNPIAMSSACNIVGEKTNDKVVGQVRTKRLDTLVDEEDIYDIGIMKIDVENHEREVLHGAEQVLELYHPKIIVECLSDEQLSNITEYLSGFGYQLKYHLDKRNYIFE